MRHFISIKKTKFIVTEENKSCRPVCSVKCYVRTCGVIRMIGDFSPPKVPTCFFCFLSEQTELSSFLLLFLCHLSYSRGQSASSQVSVVLTSSQTLLSLGLRPAFLRPQILDVAVLR